MLVGISCASAIASSRPCCVSTKRRSFRLFLFGFAEQNSIICSAKSSAFLECRRCELLHPSLPFQGRCSRRDLVHRVRRAGRSRAYRVTRATAHAECGSGWTSRLPAVTGSSGIGEDSIAELARGSGLCDSMPVRLRIEECTEQFLALRGFRPRRARDVRLLDDLARLRSSVSCNCALTVSCSRSST